MQENNRIKGYYNKKYSIITYSGTLAIESGLKTLKPDKKDKDKDKFISLIDRSINIEGRIKNEEN